MKKKSHIESILVLPDIRSTYNVGAMFRTADAAGVSKIYLTGITPVPIDKFGRARADIAKAALGAEKTVEWEYKKTLVALLKKLKKEGFTLVAIEQSQTSVPYTKIKKTAHMAFIVGPEVEGLEHKILDMCDVVAEIPMHGHKESLNVSVALGVALFRILE